MEQDNRSQVYNTYQSLKSASRFNFNELRSLFALNRPTMLWEDGVYLQTLVHNISIGRPNDPSLVDAIVAEQQRTGLSALYQFSIEEKPVTNPKCWVFTINVMSSGSVKVFGSFDAIMSTPHGEDSTWDWCIQRFVENSIKIYSIAQPGFPNPATMEQKGATHRFSCYSIFDNLTKTVTLDNMGTLYLQNLEEQVRFYAGDDRGDLFHNFRAYADAMLEMHQDYKLYVRYSQTGTDEVKLDASVYADFRDSTTRTFIVQFSEILKKVAR